MRSMLQVAGWFFVKPKSGTFASEPEPYIHIIERLFQTYGLKAMDEIVQL